MSVLTILLGTHSIRIDADVGYSEEAPRCADTHARSIVPGDAHWRACTVRGTVVAVYGVRVAICLVPESLFFLTRLVPVVLELSSFCLWTFLHLLVS